MDSRTQFDKGYVSSLQEKFQKEERLIPIDEPITIDVTATSVKESNPPTKRLPASAIHQEEKVGTSSNIWRITRETWLSIVGHYQSLKSPIIEWIKTFSHNRIFKSIARILKNKRPLNQLKDENHDEKKTC